MVIGYVDHPINIDSSKISMAFAHKTLQNTSIKSYRAAARFRGLG